MTFTAERLYADFVKRPEWFDYASCADIDARLFFGNQRADGSMQHEAEAKAVCARCAVRLDCLAQGLAEDWGIWGGRTPAERRRIRNAMGPAIRRSEGHEATHGHGPGTEGER